ncbi:hypothetical protein CRYUN_Cryun36dG0038000 [Craigia yunnanensis]
MAATLFIRCDARKSMGLVKDPEHARSSVIKHTKKLQLMSKLMSLVIEQPTDTSNTQPYGVSSPFSLLPFDSLPPVNSPPYCVNPPNTPETPVTVIPTPIGTTPSPPSPYNFPPVLPSQSPPPSSGGTVPNPPEFPNSPEIAPSPPSIFPGPPQAIPTPIIYIPSPSGPILSPPFYEPSPPAIVVSPPFYVPSPFGFNPSPPVVLPPIVYPPPTVPPPPHVTPSMALWCVAKPSVPDPIIQEAMNYACGSGADCDSIQPITGNEPRLLVVHVSLEAQSYLSRLIQVMMVAILSTTDW